jgi:NAD(P)H-hydrate epimerase
VDDLIIFNFTPKKGDTMKILNVDQIRKADAFTIKNEPIASKALMERAAKACYNWIRKGTDTHTPVSVFCGPGNNGGDGLVIARLLAGKGYKVRVFIIRFTDKVSEDFQANFTLLKKVEGVDISDIHDGDQLPALDPDELIIDAVFGSGLSKPITGFIARVISHINQSGAITIAIDTPSGLFSDESSINQGGAIIKADYTLSFQFPKYAFLFQENDVYVGKWIILPIGLMKEFTNAVEVKNFLIEKQDCRLLLKARNKFDHKGSFGHALLIAGAYGKMGAAVLASAACLRSGAGLLSTHVPTIGYHILQTALPECMVSIDENEFCFSKVPDLGTYNAIGVGPGIGTGKQTQGALKLLIQNTALPILFDADAINILAENKTWVSFVPGNSIFTPHPREFERLVGKSANQFERNKLQREFSVKYQVFVVLKGAHTCISTPQGKCFFNSTGNPGMATGGSGDVLTGIILGLLARGYTSFDACILGVYLHGLAGDIAAKKHSMESMIAGDINKYIGRAFKRLVKG